MAGKSNRVKVNKNKTQYMMIIPCDSYDHRCGNVLCKMTLDSLYIIQLTSSLLNR